MQNLKVIKAELEEKIEDLNEELEVINKALEIQEKHSSKSKENGAGFAKNVNPEKRFAQPEEIEKAILAIDGDFKAKEVEEAIKSVRKLNIGPNAVAIALFKLVNQTKQIEYIRERSGRTAAIYCRKK